MLKRLLTIFGILTLFFSFTKTVNAQDLFYAPVIPVRELNNPLQSTLLLPELFHQQATKSGTPITWLLDYDAINSATTSAFFKKIVNDKNEIGLILDITPSFLALGKIDYPLHHPTSYLLNSYHPTQREIVIDYHISQFHKVFGFYPRTVASAYLDSYSLSYLQQKYGVTGAIMDIPGLTGYQPEIEGHFPYPYFPSINNALIPASSLEEKINIVVSFWWFDITNSTLIDYRLVKIMFPGPITSSTYQNFASKFLTDNPLTTPTYNYDPSYTSAYFDSFYASPYLQISYGSQRIDNLVFFNHHETESFRFDRNPNPFLKLTTYPLVTQTNPLAFNGDLSFTSTSFSSSEKLNLPSHPQYSLLEKNSQYIYEVNPAWTPFQTPRFQQLLNFLKLLILIFLIYSLFRGKSLFHSLLSFCKNNPLTVFIILIGSYVWSITTFKSGSLTPYGLSFWGAHSHDATFHLSLIESFKHSLWPLNNPNLHNEILKNYHFFYDYLLALLSRFLNIPAIDLYFRYLPPLIALSIGFLSFSLLRRWKYSISSINFSLIFLYFTGSLGFIPSLLQDQILFGGESIFWMQQNITTLINPPFAFSLVILLLIFNLLENWKTNLNISRILILSILAASLIQIKAYASVLFILAFFFTMSTSLINRKINSSLIKLLGVIFLLTLVLFLWTSTPGSSLFVFKPFWFIDSLVAAQDRLNWDAAANALQAYVANNQWFKLVLLHFLLTLIFYVGNLGVRVFALPQWWSHFNGMLTQKISSWIILFGLTIPFFFIQSGNSWNSIQFSYYSLFFLSLLLGPVVANLLFSRRNLMQFLVIIILLAFLALPTSIGTFKEFNSRKPSTIITHEELRSLDFLGRQERKTVITPVFNRFGHQPYSSPLPLYVSDSTGYVSALTGKPVYFSDEVNLIIMDYQFKDQKLLNQKLYNTIDNEFVTSFLKENDITYLYQTPQNYLPENVLKYLVPLFNSGNYSVYTH